MMKKAILSILTLALVISFASPQPLELRFTDPLENLELTNNNITCLAQDSLGFIWIGTQSGLNRFDGYNLRHYKFVVGNLNCLIDNEVDRLYLDSQGRLWIGTHRGICRYVPEQDNFLWLAHVTDSAGMSGFMITDIREDSQGNIYVSNTLDIYRFREDVKKFEPVFRIDQGEIFTFLFDTDSSLWIGTSKDGGLIHLGLAGGNATKYLHDPKDPESISSNSPVSLALQRDKLWIATYDGGINCMDIKSRTFKKFPVVNHYELHSRVVYIDRDDRVWTVDITGLKLYDAANDVFYGYYPMKDDPYSIKNLCLGIFQDFQGNYWTLHGGEGVCLSTVVKGFQYFDTNPERFWYTSSNYVSAIAEDMNGNLWLGNPANGIDIFRWTEGRTIRYLHDPANPYSLGAGAIFSIFMDRDNRIWVGSNMGGLQYHDPATGRFYGYRNDPGDTASIANNDIRSIAEDRNGDLWVVTHGKGIDRFDRKKTVFYHYNHQNNGLSNDYCYQVLMDRKGVLWVATVWGLNKLEKGKSTFANYYKTDNDPGSLSDNNITSLFEDYLGRIWIGTHDGLNLYHEEKDNFTRYGEGFQSTIINLVLGDRNGKIWAGTAKGITLLDPETGECKNFDQHDGLSSGEINARAGFINATNALFFGGNNGVTIINPGSIRFNEAPPRVLITGLKVFNREIGIKDESGILNEDIMFTKSIKIRHRQNVITLEYLALNMVNTFRNKYAYKLEGFDKDWIDAGNKREVTYTNLDPQRYVFRVIAANNDGYWNLEGASLEVIILPPWYRTWIFRILILLLLALSYVLFHYIRIAGLEKQKANLEKEVRVRTLELKEKNVLLQQQAEELNETNALLEERQQYIEEQSEQLQAQAEDLIHANQELKQANNTKDKLFSLIAHDLKDPFNTLLGFTDLLTRDFSKIDDEQKIKIIGMIRTSSGRIHELLENMLKWARSQTGNIKVNKKAFRLGAMVKAITPVFQHTLHEKGISLGIDIPNDLEVKADKDMISTIVRNLVNNAIKFTPKGGSITITAEKKKSEVEVSVADTGIGIPKHLLKTLFDPVKQEIQRGTQGEKGSGLGLTLCREFTEIHGGRLTVRSEEGKGSTFSFTIPASPANATPG